MGKTGMSDATSAGSVGAEDDGMGCEDAAKAEAVPGRDSSSASALERDQALDA